MPASHGCCKMSRKLWFGSSKLPIFTILLLLQDNAMLDSLARCCNNWAKSRAWSSGRNSSKWWFMIAIHSVHTHLAKFYRHHVLVNTQLIQYQALRRDRDDLLFRLQ